MSKNSWKLNAADWKLINFALKEDLSIPYCDLTTDHLFTENKVVSACILSKHPEPIVFCGLPLVVAILKKLEPHATVEAYIAEGEVAEPAAKLLTLNASAKTLMRAERVILNFLQHLSAVATLTATFVDHVKHTTLKILDSRKTTPGLRHLEKYAVFCGGGVNHRMGLYDAVMIKDTHISLLGGIESALHTLPDDLIKKFPVIIEVQTLNELEIVLSQGLHKISRVLLDNMSVPLIIECVRSCQKKVPIEVSGNISLETIQAIAESGVDFASIGKLTHSAGNVDLSMKTDRPLCKN